MTAPGGERRVLGWLGVFNLALWFVPLAAYCSFEEGARCVAPFLETPSLAGWVLAKGLMDNVLADWLWARAVLLTSPTAATVGLSLTVPLAFAADATQGAAPGQRAAAWAAAGAAAVCLGVVLVAVDEGGAPRAVDGDSAAARAQGEYAAVDGDDDDDVEERRRALETSSDAGVT